MLRYISTPNTVQYNTIQKSTKQPGPTRCTTTVLLSNQAMISELCNKGRVSMETGGFIVLDNMETKREQPAAAIYGYWKDTGTVITTCIDPHVCGCRVQ